MADVLEGNPVCIKCWLCAKQGLASLCFKTYDARPRLSYGAS